jgi:DNA repair exonuclease SbcCD ATPase subunit
MLIFSKVRYKNILSTGNTWTQIDLNRSKSTLIVGENGAGKCLFYQSLVLQTTVEQLCAFYAAHPECIGKVKAHTRFGYKTVEYAGITAYDSEVRTITTRGGRFISTSPDHLLHDGTSWLKTRDIKPGDYVLTEAGLEQVTSHTLEPVTEDLYDLQIEEVKEFYANGFVSHNSTILDAVTFALYGKAFRKINKPQLLNSINQRELMVEVYFTTAGHEFVIKRGMKPNVFEIWRNGELLNQDSSTRDYQAYLEETILKMNYKSFGQIVVLGSSTFVPFMQLPAQHRREVIEDLLDIQIFSTMNNLLKERINTNKADIVEIKYRIEGVKNKLDSAREHNESVRRIRENAVSTIKDKIREKINFIDNEEINAQKYETQISELISTIADKHSIRKRLDDYKILLSDLRSKLNSVSKDVDFYSNHDNCPTCKQGIAHEFRESTVTARRQKADEIKNAISTLQSKCALAETRLNTISDIETQMQKLNISASEHRANIRIAKTVLTGLGDELTEAQREVEEVDQSKIEEYRTKLKELYAEQKTLHDDKETLSVVASMLKDGGIKTRIIKQYVPIMNKLINKYLAAMDFFVDFQLDENFNEKILSRFRDEFSYSSFSEGEKAKIDIALILTWRSISRLRNSVSTNLLIMDEVFDGSVDGNGIELLQKILLDVVTDSGLNLFVISHKDSRLDGFDCVLRVHKSKNFSTMQIEEI